MTDGLLKQLFDAKFPYNRTCGNCGRNADADETQKPTLSELIEACGERFKCLHNIGVQGSDKQWEADAFHQEVTSENVNTCLYVYGKTPEEVVAKLWLELNKK